MTINLNFKTLHIVICVKILSQHDKARSHCHKLVNLGAARNAGNINYKISKHSKHVPVFFYNFSECDYYHLLKGFGKYKREDIRYMATTSERYTSVSLHPLRTLDYLRFMIALLETLVVKPNYSSSMRPIGTDCCVKVFIPTNT